MPILIDGHNLIGRCADLTLQDPDDEAKLVRLLRSYAARTGRKITVVFDPGGTSSLSRRQRYGNVEVVFAPRDSSADAILARRIQHSRNPAEWLVVTSDLELSEIASRLGARVRSAEAFAEEACTPAGSQLGRKEIPPSPSEVQDWLALFGKPH